jgi:two-component system, cell cycle response regulator CpdR
MARILLAEDDAAMLEMVQHALTSDGHSVTIAHDGQEALDILASAGAAFNVMLTDIHMPVVDGIELAGKAVVMMPKLKVLLMSADANINIPAKLKPHIAQVLSKPLALDKLRSAVKAAVA